jgi:hypothetical protein
MLRLKEAAMTQREAIEIAAGWIDAAEKACASELGITEDEDPYWTLFNENGRAYLALNDLSRRFYGGHLPIAKRDGDPDPDAWFSEIVQIVRYENWGIARNRKLRRLIGKLDGWLEDELQRLSPQSAGEHTAGTESSAPRANKVGRKKPTTNQLMQKEIATNLSEVSGFSLRQWSKRIGRAKSTIADCKTWKDLELLREKVKAEKKMDRHGRNLRRGDRTHRA